MICEKQLRSHSEAMPVEYLGMSRRLLIFGVLVGAMVGQQAPKTPASTLSKEYSYPSDGFAIKFPSAPEPHTDSVNPDFKVWTVHLSQSAAISIRRRVDSQPCDVALAKLLRA